MKNFLKKLVNKIITGGILLVIIIGIAEAYNFILGLF